MTQSQFAGMYHCPKIDDAKEDPQNGTIDALAFGDKSRSLIGSSTPPLGICRCLKTGNGRKGPNSNFQESDNMRR